MGEAASEMRQVYLDMRHVTGFDHQGFALIDAKTVLFINDNQRQFMHINLFLDQSLSANNKTRLTALNSRPDLSFLG